MLTLIDPNKNEENFKKCLRLLPEGTSRQQSNWEMFAYIDDELDDVIGVLAYTEELDRYAIRWLYVGNDYRRLGIGTMLLETFLGYIEDQNSFKPVEIDFSSSARYLKEFFDHFDSFDLERNNDTYLIDGQTMAASKKLQQFLSHQNPKDFTIPFCDLSSAVRTNFYQKQKEKGLFIIDDRSQFEKNCEKDLSLCSLVRNEITALILTEKITEKSYAISYIYSSKPEYLRAPFLQACREFLTHYKDCSVKINPQSDSSLTMLKKLFPDLPACEENYTAIWNYR